MSPRRTTLLLVVAAIVALLVSSCSTSRSSGDSASPADSGESTTGSVLWRSGTSTSNVLGSFESTPWNTDDGEKPRAVASPDVDGRAAVAFAVPGGGTRSELEPRFGNFGEGDRYFFGLSIYLPDGFPVDTDDWQVVAQWKNSGDGSPPLSVKVKGGRFILDGDANIGDPYQRDIGPAVTGKRTDLVLGVRFSSDPSTGQVDVWQDGDHVVKGYRPPSGTLYSDEDSYMKVGLYRDSSISAEGTVYYDDVVIADGRAAAAGLASAP